MRQNRRVVGAALLLAALPPQARAQEAVVPAGTEVVRLDVVVSEEDGRLLGGLKGEDFEVLEDGKPQRLVQFVPVVASNAASRQAAPPPGDGSTGPEAAVIDVPASPGRQVAIVVDDLHIAPGNIEFAKLALRKFVDEVLAPEDFVALVTTRNSSTQPLSRDRAVLTQTINGLRWRQTTVEPLSGSQMTPAQAELILRGDRSALQYAAKSILNEPGSVFDNNGPRAATAGLSGVTPAGIDAQEREAADEAQRQARSILTEALRYSTATLITTESVMRGLAGLPGRKVIVLVSDGFLIGLGTSEERRRDMQYLIDAATRSGTVVYALDARGLVSLSPDAGVAGRNVGADYQSNVAQQSAALFRHTLETLANDTGGFLVQNTNDLAGGLRRMLADNDTYYLMAYEPQNTKRDGRFRKIEVRLKARKDVDIRTRSGYFAPEDRKTAKNAPPARPSNAALSTPTGLAAADALALLQAAAPAARLPIALQADYVQLPPEGASAIVSAHVGLGPVEWQAAGDRQRAQLDLVGGIYDAGGSLVSPPFSKRFPIDVASRDRERAASEGLYFEQRVPLPPGRYEVRVVARAPASNQGAVATQGLEVPDVSNGKLAMSGVFLTAAEGDALRDAHANRRFKPGESLSFQLYVYNAARDESGAADVVLQAQIWSAGKAVAASKPKPAALDVRDGVPVPETNETSLAGLAPGRYELRVVVVDQRAKATAFRRVDFSVE
jgi:VWFA-related protein